MTFTLAAGRPQRRVICATLLCLTVVLDGVLGPPHLARHPRRAPCSASIGIQN